MAIDRIKVFAALRLALFTLLFWGMLIALVVSLSGAHYLSQGRL